MKKRSGKKGLGPIIIIAVLTVIAGIAILAYLSGRKAPEPEGLKEVAVYFVDEEGLSLKPEKRRINKGALEEEITETVEALTEGPENPALTPPLPEGTRLLGVTVEGKTAFVDISKEALKNYQGGSTAEILIVYSIVNTVTLNFPEIKEVQLLIEGKKEQVISHIDISLPLGPDKAIIKN